LQSKNPENLNDQFPLRDDEFEGHCGSCIHQNKHPVQGDEYKYHDAWQVQPVEGIGHLMQK